MRQGDSAGSRGRGAEQRWGSWRAERGAAFDAHRHAAIAGDSHGKLRLVGAGRGYQEAGEADSHPAWPGSTRESGVWGGCRGGGHPESSRAEKVHAWCLQG